MQRTVLCCKCHQVTRCSVSSHAVGRCRYARMDFTWVATGSIQVATHIQALPSISLRTGTSASRRILAAAVLLVLLTAAQAGVVAYCLWLRISEATTFWAVLQVLSS